MKKHIAGILLVVLTLISYDYKVVADFEIVNNTEFQIDSLKIEPNVDETNKYISLNPSEKYDYKSDMTTIVKTDGAYVISFILNRQKKTQVFGYYTNGYPSEKVTKIQIKKDTILVDQIFETNK